MATLTPVADGEVAVTGDLTFDEAVAATEAGRALIAAAAGRTLRLSLAGLGRINSVSAVVLIEWQRAAVAAGVRLEIADAPARLLGILRLSGLDEVLPLA